MDNGICSCHHAFFFHTASRTFTFLCSTETGDQDKKHNALYIRRYSADGWREPHTFRRDEDSCGRTCIKPFHIRDILVHSICVKAGHGNLTGIGNFLFSCIYQYDAGSVQSYTRFPPGRRENVTGIYMETDQ